MEESITPGFTGSHMQLAATLEAAAEKRRSAVCTGRSQIYVGVIDAAGYAQLPE